MSRPRAGAKPRRKPSSGVSSIRSAPRGSPGARIFRTRSARFRKSSVPRARRVPSPSRRIRIGYSARPRSRSIPLWPSEKGPKLMVTATKLKLHTMLGNYANTAPLKSGAIHSDLVDFDFVEVKVANSLFKQVVREAKYDVAELAIATYLQAKAYGKPYVLLPAVVVSRGQHHTIAYNPERGPLKPSELNGKRVGVRAYTVTTGTWVRGILASDYGVDIDKVEWITFEDPHVAEYHDPAIVKRAAAGKDLTQMLLDGDVAAGIVGDKLPDPKLKHLIPDADAVAQKWAERHHGMPINHMVVVRQELSRSRPDVVKDIFRQLHDSKLAAGLPDGGALDPYRFGVEACRPILEIIIDFCHQQKLIPRRMSVDELFEDTTRALTV